MNLNLLNQFPIVGKLYCFQIFAIVDKVETKVLVSALCINLLLFLCNKFFEVKLGGNESF